MKPLSFRLVTAVLLLSLGATVSSQAAPALMITEFMAANSSTLADEDGEFSDWIEIHNPSDSPINLLDWSLTDSAANLTRWRFPATNFPAGGFLVVFASEKNRRTAGAPLHTNFKLSAGGEYLALIEPDGVTIATQFAPVFSPQVQDVSFGFGAELTSRVLFTTGATARVIIPADGSLGSSSAGRDFDDSAWQMATNGLGYETGVSEVNTGAAVAAIQASSPLLHLQLSETSGTTTTNAGSLGAAANGAVLNGALLNQTGARPPAYSGFESDNRAVRFDGTDDKIDVPFNAALNGTAFSFEVWAKVNGGQGAFRCPLASRDDFPQRGYILYAGSDNVWQYWTGTGAGWQSLSSGSNVVIGQWIHLVGTFDGTTKKFYVNGTLAASTNTTFSLNTARPLRLGGGATEGAGAFFFNGDIDETAVYGRALTATEVLEHYQSALTGAGGTNSSPATNFNFAAYINTDLRAAMHNVNASAYARFPFVITNLAEVDRLTLRMKYDDGFVGFLNGIEVATANAPLTENLAWNSSSTARHANTDALIFEEFDLSDSRGSLVLGTNILAIHGLNFGATNVDFLLLPELVIATSGAFSAAPRYFTAPTPGGINGVGSADLGPIITDMRFTPELPARPSDHDNITVTARVSPAFAAVTNITLRYRVMFGATNLLAMADDGAHGDGAASDGVFGAVIPPSTSTPGQMVRFLVTATDAAGRTSRWPLFEDPLGSPEYLGTVVADPTVTNTLPIYEWFTADVPNSTTRTGARASVFFNGEFFDNVFVRVRGSATTTGQKFDFNRGYHVKINDAVGRVEEINLNGTGSDPTYLRPPMAFETFRISGNAACHSFHMLMRRNAGADRVGIYVEQPDDEFLQRNGLDPEGALYKFDQRDNLNPIFSDATSGVQKRTRLYEDNSDLQALVNGLNLANQTQRIAYFFDNVNVPQLINFLAVRAINMDSDDVRKNIYMYRDSRGNREWSILPWDKDWAYGIEGDGGTWLHHPFFGDRDHAKQNANQYSMLWTVVFGDPPTREMYLRRVRTLMDQYLQPPGTTAADGWFERRVDQWYLSVSNAIPGISAQVTTLRNWFPTRRTDLFVTYAVTNTAQAATNRLIPEPQPINISPSFGAIDFNPSSSNQAQEYLCLTNGLPFALDLSGWRLDGAVQHTFAPGTVLRATNALYVSPDVTAFRARATGPRGGLGLFVQGNYQGQLSARGETVRLLDPFGNTRQTLAYPGAPSLAQQFLRITEIMYHPSPLAGNTNGPEEFEFVEVRNTSTNVTLNLSGIRFVDGIEFDFTQGGGNTLSPGQRVVVVKNAIAFASRYGWNAPLVAGEYAGSLENNGERLRLVDALGEEILDFGYNNSWHPMTDGHGFSLVVVDEHAAPDIWGDRSQWRPIGFFGGTPSWEDPPPPAIPPIRINEILSRSDVPPPPDSIELFNPTAGEVSLAGWWLSDDFNTPKKFRIPDGVTIPAGGYRVFTEDDFNPGGAGFALSSDGDEVWLFSADAAGNLTGYFHGFDFGAADDGVTFGQHLISTGEEHFVAQSARTLSGANAGPLVGPVVISEIMYRPPDLPEGSDNSADEFIELLNVSGGAVLLHDPANPTNTWRLSGGVDFVFPASQWLQTAESLLLVNFNPVTEPGQLAAFRSKYGVSPSVKILGPYRGQLANDGEDVELKRPTTPLPAGVPYVMIDKVRYRDAAPWPGGADGFGLSLQRRNASAYGNDPANWFAAPPTAGAGNPLSGAAPTLLAPPQGQIAVAFSQASFSVIAAGAAPLRYQWRFNGANLPGATNAMLTLNSVQPSQAGHYAVLVFNAAGSIVSTNATLTLLYGASILSQPQSVSLRGSTNAVDYGSTTNRSATFSVAAFSSTPITYQWRFNGVPIPDATNSSITVSNVTVAQDGIYDAALTDAIGSAASQPARLAVLLTPIILQAPVNQTVVAGGNVTLSVAISGNPVPFRYEWRRGALPIATVPASTSCTNITTVNASTAGFLLASNMPLSNFTGRIVITNAAHLSPGITTTFTVTVLADSDGDGLPDQWEQIYFGNNIGADRNADSDGDGLLNWAEQLAGTDPTNALSYLRVERLSRGLDTTLTFSAASNHTYTVLYSDTLDAGDWRPLALVPARTTNWNAVITDPAAPVRRFYRLATP